MADINDVALTGGVRYPRGIVKIGGQIITGWQSLEVVNNAHRSADTFRMVFVSSMLPPQRNLQWFASQRKIDVEVFAGFPKDPQHYTEKDLDQLILGRVDELSPDFPMGTMELNGRDNTALFIDTKTSEHFANKTASQIAETLAARHGLKAVVTPTTRMSGSFYNSDFVDTTQQQSEWDLLSYLANVEGFDLYVSGNTLYFTQRAARPTNHYLIQWTPPDQNMDYARSNIIDLQFSRNLTIAKGISVEVRSWNAKAKKGFSAFWPKQGKTTLPGQSTSPTQRYRYTVPGLTQEAAQQRAQAMYEHIISHEMHLTAGMPADNLLTVAQAVRVQGTQTDFDQVYYPESITRTLSVTDGYRMNITAKNTSPDLEITS